MTLPISNEQIQQISESITDELNNKLSTTLLFNNDVVNKLADAVTDQLSTKLSPLIRELVENTIPTAIAEFGPLINVSIKERRETTVQDTCVFVCVLVFV